MSSREGASEIVSDRFFLGIELVLQLKLGLVEEKTTLILFSCKDDVRLGSSRPRGLNASLVLSLRLRLRFEVRELQLSPSK